MRTAITKPKAALARLHCWLRVTKEHRAVAGATHTAYISLLCQLDATARLRHYDAYAVASTDYATSYIAPMGASPMGQIKTPLGQRVYRAMKRIREEIINRCSSIEAFCVVYYTSTLDPPVGVGTAVYASRWSIKGRRSLEEGVKPQQGRG